MSELSHTAVCPKCGRALLPDSPRGLCSKCLFAAMLDGGPLDVPPQATPGQAALPRAFGSYDLLEEVARGGMGIVYRARQMQINRTVAVKVLAAGRFASPDFVKRFRTEAEAVASLDHPNIVPVYEVGECEGQPFFSMKFVEGGSLARRISGLKSPIPSREAVELLARLARAVHYAHQRGILHRDLKPGNVLLDAQGEPHLTDFGLARLVEQNSTLTHTLAMLGTPSYMSPEQARGEARQLTTAVDVYGLGAIFYELLTDQPPFAGGTTMETVRLVLDKEPRRPSTMQPGMDRDLETICLKCLEKDPARRYGSAEALAVDLERWQRHEPIFARPVAGLERAAKWIRRNRVVFVALVTIALLLVSGVTVSTWQAVRANEQTRRAEVNLTMAAQAEQAATQQRIRADHETEVAQKNLYYAQMHLGLQAWREHRGLTQMRGLLANWLPSAGSPDRRGWEWFYLNSLPYQNLRMFTGSETGFVEVLRSERFCTVAWNIPSRRLAEGNLDGLIRIWDVDREQAILVLKGPKPASYWPGFAWLGWSPDGGQLAAGGKDGSVHIWAIPSGREIQVLRGHKHTVVSVAYSSDGSRVASWEGDGRIKIWNVSSGVLTAEVLHLKAGVNMGAWSPDDKLLASGSYDGTVIISGTNTGDKFVTLRGHARPIYRVAFSPDSARLVSTSADHTARIWEVASQKMVLGPLQHSHEITAVAWEPDGSRLATGSVDETIKVWNAATGHEVVTLRGHLHAVPSLAWGPEGRLASGGRDGSMMVWNSLHDQESSVLPGHVGRATSVVWSPDGQRLASGGDDGKIRIWNAATRAEVQTLAGHDVSRIKPELGLIRSLAWNPNGSFLASAGLDGAAKVWEVDSGREVFALPAGRVAVWAVAWNRDGTRLAAGSEDGTIRVVEGIGRTPVIHVLQTNESGSARSNSVHALAWNPKLNHLASKGGFTTKIWDPARGLQLARIEHRKSGWTVAWSPDGRRLATVSATNATRLIVVCDADNGQTLSTLRGHNDNIDSVAWSPDGTRLASASLDNSVRVWDPATGGETFVLRGKGGMFYSVAWSPDGKQLAAASSDGQIWIWNATAGFEQGSAGSK